VWYGVRGRNRLPKRPLQIALKITQLPGSAAENGTMNTTASSVGRSTSMAAIIGRSPRLLATLEQAVRLAKSRLPVLVTGESGTGKELIAHLLHEHGPNPNGPFVAVNCGALSRELAESELFGHERGAFTGANQRKIGWFEEAVGGTLVLDEIGELPLDLQPKLLRVLETGRLRRVGGHGEIALDIRIIALTLRDLRRDINRGQFRSDLYFRLAGGDLRLPPLRDRASDLLLLAEHFLSELTQEIGPRTLDDSARAALCAYSWPGNVRELRHTLRRAALFTDHTIDASTLNMSCEFTNDGICDVYLPSRAADGDSPLPTMPITNDTLILRGKSYAELQAAIFRWALARNGGSRRKAASALGISRSTFCDRVRRLPDIGPGKSTRHHPQLP
jgi:DNA-binding NtrC family response regulator